MNEMAKAKPKIFYSYRDLVNNLRAGEGNIPFYIYGKDSYIAERLITNLYTQQLNENFLSFNLKKLDAKKMSAENLIDECNVLPVFDTKKCLLIYDSPIFSKNKSYEKQAKELIAYLEEMPEYLLLAFFSEENAAWSNTAFSYFLKKNAALDFGTAPERLMGEWLGAGAKSIALSISQQNADYLMRYCGYDAAGEEVNARMLYTELMKLSSYCDGREVTKEDIRSICTPYGNESLDEMLNGLNEKKLSEALSLSVSLMKNNIYPTVLLNAVANNFLTMLLYKEHEKNKRMAVWDMLSVIKQIDMLRYARKERVENIMRHSKNFTREKICDIIVAAAKYDDEVKSGKIDAKAGFEQLLCHIVS